MKLISMYLPQFHRIKENDLWWGEGFTEWSAVKRAKPLFEGHKQPKMPYEGYYDLLDKCTMKHQTDLMKRYGIDGMCFYHYWFEKGRKVLEKPAENLLKWKEVDMPFCFCWANETWARTWSNIVKKNAWADVLETEQSYENNGILLKQVYGGKKDWEEHFRYFLSFFKDKRYITTENGNPVLLLYNPSDIYCLNEMVEFWKVLCRKEKMKDLYIIGVNVEKKVRGLDAVLFLGPSKYIDGISPTYKNNVRIYDYSSVWQRAIDKTPIEGVKTFFGGFTSYDDTPRRGARGTVIENSSPELFEKYMHYLVQKNKLEKNDFLFLNAWNEWGEGMYLEPDSGTEYKYLIRVAKIKEEADKPYYINNTYIQNEKDSDRELYLQRDKFQSYYECFDNWMKLLEQEIGIEKYFQDKGIKEIVIYGWGPLGKHLFEMLRKRNITVSQIIDKDSQLSLEEVKIGTIEAIRKKPLIIVVTAFFYFDEIVEELEETLGTEHTILSLNNIINELLIENIEKFKV